MAHGSTEVLHGLAVGMSRGEVLALLCPNGAGKTTTFEIFEGFRAPRRARSGCWGSGR